MKQLIAKLSRKQWRAITANCFMLTFILLTGIGAYMITPAVGFITAGVGCGLFGFLLGSE